MGQKSWSAVLTLTISTGPLFVLATEGTPVCVSGRHWSPPLPPPVKSWFRSTWHRSCMSSPQLRWGQHGSMVPEARRHKSLYYSYVECWRENWPSQCQWGAFYRQAQTWPCCLHPEGEPTSLPVPPCWTSQGHCQKWHHKMKVSWWVYSSLVFKGLKGASKKKNMSLWESTNDKHYHWLRLSIIPQIYTWFQESQLFSQAWDMLSRSDIPISCSLAVINRSDLVMMLNTCIHFLSHEVVSTVQLPGILPQISTRGAQLKYSTYPAYALFCRMLDVDCGCGLCFI